MGDFIGDTIEFGNGTSSTLFLLSGDKGCMAREVCFDSPSATKAIFSFSGDCIIARVGDLFTGERLRRFLNVEAFFFPFEREGFLSSFKGEALFSSLLKEKRFLFAKINFLFVAPF